MRHCNTCGRKIPDNTGVVREIKTGSFSGGQNYYRTVNLCEHCADKQTQTAKTSKGRAIIACVGGVLLLSGGAVYWLFFR